MIICYKSNRKLNTKLFARVCVHFLNNDRAGETGTVKSLLMGIEITTNPSENSVGVGFIRPKTFISFDPKKVIWKVANIYMQGLSHSVINISK